MKKLSCSIPIILLILGFIGLFIYICPKPNDVDQSVYNKLPKRPLTDAEVKRFGLQLSKPFLKKYSVVAGRLVPQQRKDHMIGYKHSGYYNYTPDWGYYMGIP